MEVHGGGGPAVIAVRSSGGSFAPGPRAPAKLALENGSVFPGWLLGAPGESLGEVVFNTSLTGYQEIFTDASYYGQTVVMTNPLIGNYGINVQDEESARPYVQGIVIREASRTTSNFRSEGDLASYLQRYGIVGITGVDTRAVTKLLRISGSLKGVISSVDLDDRRLVEKARAWEGLIGRDMVVPVTCKKAYHWKEGPVENYSFGPPPSGAGLKVVAFDFGIKKNILRIMTGMGFEVTVVPARTTAGEVHLLKPDGVFLSNGPGDPEGVPYAIDCVRKLIGEYPLFGICLGHQLLGLALGGRTYKLKFGHHGGNHPVQNLFNRKVEISVQNHCFAVDLESLPAGEVKPYFVNLNDGSNEGLVHTRLPLFSVQFHPEAAPGPTDFTFLFEQFSSLIRKRVPIERCGAGAPG
jgi:carbamoyl-phosphate synthase small subunit